MSLYIDINKDLSSFNLEVAMESKGGIIGFLGASGSGKSMTLKCIAGLEKADSGKIIINEKVLFDSENKINIKTKDRKVGFLFQNYALFPHMTIRDNIEIGLDKLRKIEKNKLSSTYIEKFGLNGLENRYPWQLSGGQQQRVALVRSLITKPKVLLLDEPLSNLDAKLRVKMREEIREIQKKYEITMVFVTHDQEEAMVLGDKIAIMDQGKLIQIGRPEEVYLHPQNDFARDFLGISNQFTDMRGNHICCRPEELEFVDNGTVKGIVKQEEFLGFYRQYHVETETHENIIVRTDRGVKKEVGKEIQLQVK